MQQLKLESDADVKAGHKKNSKNGQNRKFKIADLHGASSQQKVKTKKASGT